jgi:hypothetical protein
MRWMPDSPGGLTHGAVRKPIRRKMMKRVMDDILGPRLSKLSADADRSELAGEIAESHQWLLSYTRPEGAREFHPSYKGRLAEMWEAAVFPHSPSAEQVSVPSGTGGIANDRRLDRLVHVGGHKIDGKLEDFAGIREVRHVSGKFSETEKSQFRDLLSSWSRKK